MTDFGYSIAPTRRIDLDSVDARLRLCREVLDEVPSSRLCIGCGTCTAGCPAAQFSDFNIRRVHLSFARGRHEGLAERLQRCMLCGKCLLACPRGVNTRGLIISYRKHL